MAISQVRASFLFGGAIFSFCLAPPAAQQENRVPGQSLWPPPIEGHSRVRCPQRGLAAWPSALMAVVPLPNFSLPIPATPAHAGNRSMGQTLSSHPTPSYTRQGCPEKGIPCLRSHDNQILELGPFPPSHGLLGWEGSGKPITHRLTPPVNGPPGYVNIFFSTMSEYFFPHS